MHHQATEKWLKTEDSWHSKIKYSCINNIINFIHKFWNYCVATFDVIYRRRKFEMDCLTSRRLLKKTCYYKCQFCTKVWASYKVGLSSSYDGWAKCKGKVRDVSDPNQTVERTCNSKLKFTELKGCVRYIFAGLFCMSKREHLWNKEKWVLFHFESSSRFWDNHILTF